MYNGELNPELGFLTANLSSIVRFAAEDIPMCTNVHIET